MLSIIIKIIGQHLYGWRFQLRSDISMGSLLDISQYELKDKLIHISEDKQPNFYL